MSSPADLFPQTSSSEAETRALGKQFGARLAMGDVVALVGDLGAGKTQFVKGVAEAFGISPEDVSSPTFTIAHEYGGHIPLYHLDLYRLSGPAELQQSGVEEYFDMDGICLVEWPERAEHLLPERVQIIRLTHLQDGNRRIEQLSV